MKNKIRHELIWFAEQIIPVIKNAIIDTEFIKTQNKTDINIGTSVSSFIMLIENPFGDLDKSQLYVKQNNGTPDFSDRELIDIITRLVDTNTEIVDELIVNILQNDTDCEEYDNFLVVPEDVYHDIKEKINCILCEKIENDFTVKKRFSSEQIIAFYFVYALRNTVDSTTNINKKDIQNFIGRAEEYKSLEQNLVHNSFSVISGNYKSGKTMFVKWYAKQQKETDVIITDGSKFDNLRDILDQICLTEEIILKRIGIDLRSYENSLLIIKRLMKNLPRRLLFIIDNFNGTQKLLEEIYDFSQIEKGKSKIQTIVVTDGYYKNIKSSLRINPLSEADLEKLFWKCSNCENKEDLKPLVNQLCQETSGQSELVILFSEAYKAHTNNAGAEAGKQLIELYLNEISGIDSKSKILETKYNSSIDSAQLTLRGHIRKIYSKKFGKTEAAVVYIMACLKDTPIKEKTFLRLCHLEKTELDVLRKSNWIESATNDSIISKVPRVIALSLITNEEARKNALGAIHSYLRQLTYELRNVEEEFISTEMVLSLIERTISFDSILKKDLLQDDHLWFKDEVREFYLFSIHYCVQNGNFDLAETILEEKIPFNANDFTVKIWRAIVNANARENPEFIKRLTTEAKETLSAADNVIVDLTDEECLAYLEFYKYLMDSSILHFIEDIIENTKYKKPQNRKPYINIISEEMKNNLEQYNILLCESKKRSHGILKQINLYEYIVPFLRGYCLLKLGVDDPAGAMLNISYVSNALYDCISDLRSSLINNGGLLDNGNRNIHGKQRRELIEEFDALCDLTCMIILYVSVMSDGRIGLNCLKPIKRTRNDIWNGARIYFSGLNERYDSYKLFLPKLYKTKFILVASLYYTAFSNEEDT
ncbi:MAG: hypothetical protein LUG99_21420 [Lachnospiraceae bacterium]|nr:hypothetical protein [Lachnospiraceae bacterium]